MKTNGACRPDSLHRPSARAVIVMLMAAAVLLGCSKEQRPSESASAAPAVETSGANEPDTAAPPAHFNGQRAMQYIREVVAFGPRPVGSPGHQKLEEYIRAKLRGNNLEEDAFTASTPNGPRPMRNFIAKFPGTREGIIVVAGHYDTKPLKDFVGANDGGSSTGLPLQLASELAAAMKNGKRAGYSVWIALLDGEESIQQSNDMDFSNSMYGSQHLAQKWQQDGTSKTIQAFLLVDMIGDADLNVDRDQNSTAWLEDLVLQAARRLGYQSHFFRRSLAIDDDHIPFAKIGVPVADLIDLDYGYNNVFWHTPADSLDKLSANSLEIVGSVVLETIRLLERK